MDATFWAMIALFIFIGVVVYMKVPGMIAKALDERAAKIRNDLDDARRLREEAQQLLVEFQKKRKEAEKEAPGFSFVVRHISIDFRKPAFMDDVLDIVTTPEEVKGASVTLNQKVVRGVDLLVEAHVQVAFVSGGRAKPIPKPLRVAMKADQESGGVT